MSSLPGYTLESYLAWNYDVVVEDLPDANFSLALAEMMGSHAARKRISSEMFASVVQLFEPYRESAENALMDFDEETQSWRDYAGYNFDFIPHSVFDEGANALDEPCSTATNSTAGSGSSG